MEDKATEELREVEINDLPDKEFKFMILKMFKELKINWMNRVEKLKVFNKELNKLDQRDLDRQIHRENIPLKVAECIFFLSTHGTFTTTDYILGYKMHLSKFQGISILQTTFPHHRTIKLEINNRKMSFKRCFGQGINSLGEKNALREIHKNTSN